MKPLDKVKFTEKYLQFRRNIHHCKINTFFVLLKLYKKNNSYLLIIHIFEVYE